MIYPRPNKGWYQKFEGTQNKKKNPDFIITWEKRMDQAKETGHDQNAWTCYTEEENKYSFLEPNVNKPSEFFPIQFHGLLINHRKIKLEKKLGENTKEKYKKPWKHVKRMFPNRPRDQFSFCDWQDQAYTQNIQDGKLAKRGVIILEYSWDIAIDSNEVTCLRGALNQHCCLIVQMST